MALLQADPHTAVNDRRITIFLCGDVMTGRGIDQILPHPADPLLHEPYIKDARGYLALAEAVTGPIPHPVDFDYIWGDACAELRRRKPEASVINLETSVTADGEYWEKGINYRMNPDNLPCLKAAGINCCALANNHTLDWGHRGLFDTLDSLAKAGIKTCGAGRSGKEAQSPAVIGAGSKGRVIVFSYGSPTSGIPLSWEAQPDRAGVNLLKDFSDAQVGRIREEVAGIKQAGDIVIASIHWGANWGYDVPEEQRSFARRLVDKAGIDIIHGHSSHHPKGIEIYKGKPVIYGCGDFLNDYEGIPGYEEFRQDLSLMYFIRVDPRAAVPADILMSPCKIRHFRINRAGKEDREWLRDALDREGAALGTRVCVNAHGDLAVERRR